MAVGRRAFRGFFTSGPGQPPKPIRLMVGLLMLSHIAGLSEEATVAPWVENPDWQFFCGYDHLHGSFLAMRRR